MFFDAFLVVFSQKPLAPGGVQPEEVLPLAEHITQTLPKEAVRLVGEAQMGMEI